MTARRRRLLAGAALIVLVLAEEVFGRWIVSQLTIARRVPERPHDGVDVYPVVVGVAKLGMALLIARLAWRVARTRRLATARERMLERRGCAAVFQRPRLTIGLSRRVWFVAFGASSLLYLVPTSTAEVTNGCWPVLSPWLHTTALPVFAVLAVVVSVAWRSLVRWLHASESYASSTLPAFWARARGLLPSRRSTLPIPAPRVLFGLAFHVRPPPFAA